MESEIIIKMLRTVKPDIPFLCKPNTVAIEGKEYTGVSNKYGAVSVVCDNGEHLGVKPNEFEFVKAPKWLLDMYKD